MIKALMLAALACLFGLTARAAPRRTLIERVEADLARDRAFSAAERKQYLAGFRTRLGAYAFDVLKGRRAAAADVLMSVVVEGSFDKAAVARTVAIAAAAYVAVSRGANAAAVRGIALYGFSKKLESAQIEALANGYHDLTRFGVPADVAKDLVYNAASHEWPTDVFNMLKWGLVQAARAGYDCRAFARYMVGNLLKGGTRPGAMVSKATRVFRDAARAGRLPKLPAYHSPTIEAPAPKPPVEHHPPRPPRPAKNVAALLEHSIESFLGTPYVWGGHTRRGTDCSGFVQAVFAEAGISLPRTSAMQWKSGTKVAREYLRKGDLVFFRTIGRSVSHVGIVTDPAKNLFAHASSSRGVVISDLDSRYYSARYAGARRVIGR